MGKGREINEKFGLYLKFLRENKGYSLIQLQELTGISSSYINRLESGDRKAPSYPIIERLAEALGVDVIELLNISGTAKTDKTESIFQLILKNDFTIDEDGNDIATPVVKQLLTDLLQNVLTCKWSDSTRFSDIYTLLKSVDELKKAI